MPDSNLPASAFDAPALPKFDDNGDTVSYLTHFELDGKRHTAAVAITKGYSTFEDIRKILAIKHIGSSRPSAIERITIIVLTLDD